MKIKHESNSGIEGFRNLGIEGILSLLIPKSLNLAQKYIDSDQKSWLIVKVSFEV